MWKREESENIINGSNKVSLKAPLLKLPKDIWNYIFSFIPDPVEAIKIRRTLSRTCKGLNSFFKSDLDKSDAQRLLSYVLQGNAEKAKKMYDANPRLLFIEATAQEYAAGIDGDDRMVHRVQTESPFKAAARAGDTWMLKEMAGKILDPNSHEYKNLAKKQLAEIFPNDFKYPPSTYDFNDLVKAISHDPILKSKNTLVKPGKSSQKTEEVLAKFRKHFLPDNKKVGYHFNLNELIKACEIYDNNHFKWNVCQARVFWCQVVGYLERLVSACDAQVLCHGIKDVLEGESLKRSFNLYFYVKKQKMIPYFPLVEDPSYYLGKIFAVDSYYGSYGVDVGEVTGANMSFCFKKLCQSKMKGLEEFKEQLYKSDYVSKVNQEVKVHQGCCIA